MPVSGRGASSHGRGLTVAAAAFIAVGLAVAAFPAWSMPMNPNTVRLLITGESGARFEGRCTVFGAHPPEAVDLAGTVPYQHDFAATGLSCQLAARGGLMVEVMKGTQHMFWQVRDGVVTVSIG